MLTCWLLELVAKLRGWVVVVLVLSRPGLTAPPISWLKGRLVAEEAGGRPLGPGLPATAPLPLPPLASLRPVAGMEPARRRQRS